MKVKEQLQNAIDKIAENSETRCDLKKIGYVSESEITLIYNKNLAILDDNFFRELLRITDKEKIFFIIKSSNKVELFIDK